VLHRAAAAEALQVDTAYAGGGARTARRAFTEEPSVIRARQIAMTVASGVLLAGLSLAGAGSANADHAKHCMERQPDDTALPVPCPHWGPDGDGEPPPWDATRSHTEEHGTLTGVYEGVVLSGLVRISVTPSPEVGDITGMTVFPPRGVGEVLTRLTGPPWEFTWDTTTAPNTTGTFSVSMISDKYPMGNAAGIYIWDLSIYNPSQEPAEPPVEPPSFTDVGGGAHTDGIAFVASRGITTGYSDGTFRPDDTVTRAQMATFLARATNLPPGGTVTFPDVPADSTHAANIAAIASVGWSTGRADGTFGPGEIVTRGQMATFLSRALGPYSNGDPEHSFTDVTGHAHESRIADIALGGITTGYPDGTFRPDLSVTRGQMATFLMRALDR
jgi:hypothetical protein